MRILILNNEFPPLGGGTGTVNHALLTRWAQELHLDIELVTSAVGREYRQHKFAERVQLHFVPVDNRNLHHSSNRELATYAARALPYALRLHRERHFDFVMAWSAVPAGAVGLAFKKITGRNYMLRVCGPDIPGFEQRYGALYPILSPVIRATWRGAQTVIAKCEDEAAMIRRVDVSVRVSIVPNGVDVSQFETATISENGPLRLVCVARLIERKGQHYLIEAVKRLTDAGVNVTLDLVGTGDAQEANEKQVRELGIADRVRFLGYVPREEIAQRYANADVFVLASYNEGMSVATLEAMAAGLPLVVTRTPGTKELVQPGVNGLLFDWADTEALTAHLERLAKDRQQARKMGAASREKAMHMTWDAVAKRYLELFDDVANTASRNPARWAHA